MASSPLVLVATDARVTTLTLNDPRRLNGWTMPMMEALREALKAAAADADTAAVILTGADPYYCAGVNLSATVRPAHPRSLHQMIVAHNQALFDSFIDFPKPILVAVNGPAIGACVTSATLCDGVIASEKATFSTPFVALGVPPEGCSSVHFARLMGQDNAQRMLGPEGFKPTGAEAVALGLAQWVVPHDQLMSDARRLALEWVEAGRGRSFRGGVTAEELRAVNAKESVEVADAFLAPRFLMGQFRFLWGKKKRGPALVFLALRLTRPLWGLLL